MTDLAAESDFALLVRVETLRALIAAAEREGRIREASLMFCERVALGQEIARRKATSRQCPACATPDDDGHFHTLGTPKNNNAPKGRETPLTAMPWSGQGQL